VNQEIKFDLIFAISYRSLIKNGEWSCEMSGSKVSKKLAFFVDFLSKKC
jgi:hypothetical protein